MDTNITSLHKLLLDGTFASHIERKNSSLPTVIVIGGGISGLAAARILFDASFKVILLESRDRLGGRIHTDYSFGYPVDLGASCYTLFDADGHQVPQQLVKEVGDIFKKILKETERIRDEHTDDMSILQAIGLVLDRHPELRQEGLANEVLQWYICRMEAWFAVDADMISLKTWDQEHVLSGGHGLMGKKNMLWPNKVMVMLRTKNLADAAIVTVPIGILKANLIQFEPKLPEWKVAAISDIGVGSENKVALQFDKVFWPNVEFLGIVAPTSYACGYFLNLHKATGHPVLVYMAADPNSLGCYAYDVVGKPEDVYERLRAPLGNLFFGGEAVSMDHQGSVHGAYSAGVAAAQSCQRHVLERLGNLEKLQLVPLRCEIHEAAFPLQISRM
ncbi:hypothetical protein GH714_014294 [Hevea brasiliensis]|uniref:Amine oxidase domain-containing protein n=1 Tax=Hevea brasiliensis TaxID=3981 RepID=A0A6A6KNI1_HEVBR|nr:hypothetical protein GH714_014294 [Hevea brasiliensis]